MRLLRNDFIPLLANRNEVEYVIKKGDSYSCIATKTLKFLDMINYLAPGISYDKFLKSQNVAVTKSFFPYEYFDSLQRLNETEFPPYEAFHSSLKGRNTLVPLKNEILTEKRIVTIL